MRSFYEAVRIGPKLVPEESQPEPSSSAIRLESRSIPLIAVRSNRVFEVC